MTLLQIQKRKMALAGMLMTAFLLIHMLTNLTLFSVQSAQQFYDWYQQPWIRWPILSGFTLLLLMHVAVAVRIRKKNAQARTVAYQRHARFHVPASVVSSSITLLFLFILFHVYQSLRLDEVDIQVQVAQWFTSPVNMLIYCIGLVILTAHLMHALINVLQTLGKSSKTYKGWIVSAVGIFFMGFISVPVYFFWSV